jgi:hypothetical protein
MCLEFVFNFLSSDPLISEKLDDDSLIILHLRYILKGFEGTK